MLALDQVQAAMMQALDHGPEFLPDRLFAGAHARVLAGMKVHANTISHARLVALEDTFPRVLALLGQARFNEHSRLYIHQPGVTAKTLAGIGEAFPGWLATSDEAGAAVDLARFEWLWLEAYHARDAVPLRLADLAGLGEQALLDLAIAAHPSASIGTFDRSVHEAIGVEVAGLVEAPAILVVRPEADVLVSPASAAMRAIFATLKDIQVIGNLLGHFDEPDCKDRLSSDDFMAALIALLEAGALIRAERRQVE
ncbi:putative DNA-binding domain-containing protein [Novosphingobium sp.]|uniref:HvfC/BufC family peptide modification chaperone n=1 Tax=Novosphingobium sp. TaxID=1874826 RepID=UPI0027357D1F|nr:putative DNA-binding domain-containing protein [Novosphingobium sp.]MDP3906722.1 putative DNA-binding domain-containing protein [Novosphingobium sp.]